MIQIMANENMEDWETTTAGTNETVRVARDFLNGELAKYDMWEELPLFLRAIFEKTKKEGKNPTQAFAAAKRKDHGVGVETILKFLGKNWKQWMIQEALESLKDTEIDITATEKFEQPSTSTIFKRAVRKINKDRIEEGKDPIPKEETPLLAEKVQKRIAENKGKGLGEKSYSAVMETLVNQKLDGTDEFEATVNNIVLELQKITNDTGALANKIALLNGRLLSLGVKDIKHLSSLFLIDKFYDLSAAINTLLHHLGIKEETSNEN